MIPSREAEDVAYWLKQYPDVEVVRRDRSPIYTAAVSLALPNADQIADRFHIIKNIYEVLEKILHQERKIIAQVSEENRQAANRISRENQSLIENERFKMPKNTKGAA